MFERYTEKARRTIFFARYEASEFGSPYIETEHLLLGIIREDKALIGSIPNLQPESVRRAIQAHSPVRERTLTSVDLPLSNECKRVLAYAAEEAEKLDSKPITPGHLLLGLLRVKTGFAAVILKEQGLELSELRRTIAELPAAVGEGVQMITIHGRPYSAGFIEAAIADAKKFAWQQKKFIAPDILVHREDRRISFDLKLAANSSEFELVKGGWKETKCKICMWELTESDDVERGLGYTNGRHWMCIECHDKFMAGD